MALGQALISFSLAAIFFSLVSMWRARRYFSSPYTRIRNATAPGADGTGDGPVLAVGTAARDAGTVRSMLDEEALCAVSAIYEYKAERRRAGWYYLAYRIDSARFAVQTANGRCLVPSIQDEDLPYNAIVGLASSIERVLPIASSGGTSPTRERWRVEADGPDYCLTVPYAERDELPAEAATMERLFDVRSPRRPFSLPYLRRHNTRRYQEFTIEAGDEITVIGTLEDRADGDPVLTAPEDGLLIVSTLSPEELEDRYRRLYHWYLYKLPGLIMLVWVLLSVALVLAFVPGLIMLVAVLLSVALILAYDG